MTYQIIPASCGHLEQIAAIERLCFSDPWSRHLLEGLLDTKGAVFLTAAGEDGTILGYISAQAVLAEGYITTGRRDGAVGCPPQGGTPPETVEGLRLRLCELRLAGLGREEILELCAKLIDQEVRDK